MFRISVISTCRKPGSAARPKTDAKASETRDLAYGLVRVIDDKGLAVGAWNPKLDR